MQTKKNTIKLLVVIGAFFLLLTIVLLGSNLFFKSNETLSKVERKLLKNGFVNNGAKQFEYVYSGLNQEEYLKSSNLEKKSIGLIIDTKLHTITYFENQTNLNSEVQKSITVNADYTAKSYISMDEDNYIAFTKGSYNIKTNNFICENATSTVDECNNLQQYSDTAITIIFDKLNQLKLSLEDLNS